MNKFTQLPTRTATAQHRGSPSNTICWSAKFANVTFCVLGI